MKIALVVPGGVDRSGTHRVIPCLLWLIERLAREHDLHVFATGQEPGPSTYDLLGARVHNAGRRPRRLRTLGAIAAEHSRSSFHVLHAVWATPPGVIAAAAGALLGRPVLLHLTGGDLAALPEIGYGLQAAPRGRLWLRTAVRGARVVTVPSGAMEESARRMGLFVRRLPYGVALDRWAPLPSRRRNPGPARLLHVGSLNPVKDQATLLLAAGLLREAGLDFRLDVVGEDTLGGVVQTLVRELGLEPQVAFHGFLPHEELRPLMEAAHVLLVSSRHEADPIVALEAAVAGVPVVGTSVGHIRDWAPEAAVAVPVGDHAALAQETLSLLRDEERRLGLVEAAQEVAVRWDADWTAAAVNRIYREMQRDGARGNV